MQTNSLFEGKISGTERENPIVSTVTRICSLQMCVASVNRCDLPGKLE